MGIGTIEEKNITYFFWRVMQLEEWKKKNEDEINILKHKVKLLEKEIKILKEDVYSD